MNKIIEKLTMAIIGGIIGAVGLLIFGWILLGALSVWIKVLSLFGAW